MTAADLAVAVLGVSTGFASTVWVIVGWTSIRLHQWWPAFCYASLVVVNALSTLIIGAGLVGHHIALPQGSATLLLMPIIILPPILSLNSWRASRPVIHHQQDIR